jgi:hypothetical protein
MKLYSVLRHENHPLHKPIKKRKPKLKPNVTEEHGEIEQFVLDILLITSVSNLCRWIDKVRFAV